MLDDLTSTTLGSVSLTLTVCLVIIVGMAAIGRDFDGVRIAAIFAVAMFAVCLLAQVAVGLGWLGLDVIEATLFGFYAQSRGRSFVAWFAITFFIGWLLALGVMKLVDWLRTRGSEYGTPAPAPA